MKSERMLKTIGISSVPEGWAWKRIDECFDIIKRRNDNNSENVLTISSLSGFVNQKERFSKVIAGENLKKYTLLRKGEFSYNKGNSKTFPCGCIFLLEDYEEAAVPNVYISFKSKNEISNRFYRYYFQNRLLDGQLKRLINTGVRNDGLLNINTDEFCSVYILVPSIKEQEKIAEIILSWDLAIEKQEQLIEKKKEFKKGLLQRLLSREVRFKEFKDEWISVKLKELAEIYQPKTITSSDLKTSGFPVYGANGVIGYYDKYNHEKEQIAITCRGSSCGTVNMTVKKAWITGNSMVVNVDNNNFINKLFMYYCCKNEDFSKIISGSGQPQITRNPLANYIISIPQNLEEQLKISGVLESADKEIELLEKELEALKLQKKGLMQRLLTGEVRVKV